MTNCQRSHRTIRSTPVRVRPGAKPGASTPPPAPPRLHPIHVPPIRQIHSRQTTVGVSAPTTTVCVTFAGLPAPATSFLIVLGATLSTYRIFWKPTGIADSVESATTVHKTPSTTAAAPTTATG